MKYEDKNIVVIKTDIQQILPLEYIKNYLRIDNNCDDEFLSNAATMAINYAETFTGKIFGVKVYKLTLKTDKNILKIDDFTISSNDLVSISVDDKYITHEDFELKDGIVCFKRETKGSINIIFKKEGILASEVPADIKQAILFHIAGIYQNKNGDCQVPKATQEIYNMYRKIRV